MKALSAAKARDMMTTNVLCGEERPAPEPQPAVQHDLPVDRKTVTGMTIHELRIALRARGLSPAGAHATLVERLLAGLAEGATPLLLPHKEFNAGVDSSYLAVAYARADGALSDTPVHRGGAMPPAVLAGGGVAAVLAGDAAGEAAPPPSPGHTLCEAALAQMASHISFSADDSASDEPARAVHPRRAADLAGNSVFTPAAPEHGTWSELKAKDYKGNNIFDAGEAPERLTGVTQRPLPAKRVELESRVVADGVLAGLGEEQAPAIALSSARSAELSGEAVFTVAALPLPSPPPMNSLKAAELGSTAFEDGEVPGKRSPGAGPSPPVVAGRARTYSSTWLTEQHLGPQPQKDAPPPTVQRVTDLYAQGAGAGCTMAYAEGDASPLPGMSSGGIRGRRSSGGGVSSVVFG